MIRYLGSFRIEVGFLFMNICRRKVPISVCSMNEIQILHNVFTKLVSVECTAYEEVV